MKKTIVLVFHPYYDERSKNIKGIVNGIKAKLPEVTIKIMDQKGNFDVAKEQAEILKYDNIFFAYPIHWYTAPWTLKRYIDEVFWDGFAFSFTNKAEDFKLRDKKFGIIASAGNNKSSYTPPKGANLETIENHSKWLTTLFHLVHSAWPIEGEDIEPNTEKYLFPIIVSYEGALNPDNSANNNKAVEEFIKILNT